MPFGTKTTRCQQVRRNDENYIYWSEALSVIHQPFRLRVCHNFALWRECSRLSYHVHFRKQQQAKHSSLQLTAICKQLENVCDTNSNALENQQPQSTQISTIATAPLIQSLNRMASNVSMSTTTTSGFFNSCNIQGNVQVFFGLQTPLQSQKVTWFLAAFWIRFVAYAVNAIVSSRTSNAWFKLYCAILWTNRNPLLSIAQITPGKCPTS